jgi:hypothetical protein
MNNSRFDGKELLRIFCTLTHIGSPFCMNFSWMLNGPKPGRSRFTRTARRCPSPARCSSPFWYSALSGSFHVAIVKTGHCGPFSFLKLLPEFFYTKLLLALPEKCKWETESFFILISQNHHFTTCRCCRDLPAPLDSFSKAGTPASNAFFTLVCICALPLSSTTHLFC